MKTKEIIKKLTSINKYALGLSLFAISVVLTFGGYYSYIFASTPQHLKYPEIDHYHLRTQIIVDGTAVDFSEAKYQEDSDAGSCTANLGEGPIDFHDNEDQMTHIHWRNTTGGELLKYFGWNLIGGEDNTLGTRFDKGMMQMHKIPIHNNALPEIPDGSKFFIYTGDENSFQSKDWNDFLNLNLEDFLGKQSFLNPDYQQASFNLLDLFTAKAYAHGTVQDSHPTDATLTNDDLARINNLLGNIVIFVQAEQPSNDEIQARFDNLHPLSDSVCGG